MPVPNHEPNFERILHSDIWREEITPLLDGMIAYQVKLLATAELRDVKTIQGRLQALQALRETPQDEVDFERVTRNQLAKRGLLEPEPEQEQEDNGSGRTGKLWGRRWFGRG